ncbi:hypothetical protein M409DRAFT_60839 [Zasmidium cellare ATCC 36951]|uniref:Uncharacterized protein n=1 Tax=Zasmidium cellare ATCC 36951 TaxID=1080233 RepID=A0A6A6BX54_ZASCE|nr:uncharacterized protein M409DRAFT_60839 [Zasmidium cellare ATCC 36951]KAF2159367.1 hypothetical protein M409DRAFT_60839 [Zasmidium cellare ATCC 36951]
MPSTPAHSNKPIFDPFEDDLNKHPEDHFLSPVQMYEYEDWAEDSEDEDAEEIEWDAGITDFALFDNDRRHAQQRHEEVPDRWDGLLASQASALQRAVLRNRANSDPSGRQWTPLLEDLPQLTPDNSPNLKGDHDIHSYCGPKTTRPSVPNYLAVKVTPPPEDDYDFDDDEDEEDSDEDDLPVSYLVARARERRRVAHQMERPGLRFNRTMSGKVHVWRRPSYHLYSVGEEAEAESEAEMEDAKTTTTLPVDMETRGRSRR